MKKISFATLVLSLGLMGGLGMITDTADAATVHHGIPKVMRHTKWRSNLVSMKGFKARNYVTFYNKTLTSNPIGAMNAGPVYHVKYKYLGNHTYYLTATNYNNAPTGGLTERYKFKRLNSHTIYFKDYHLNAKFVAHKF